MRCYKTCKFHGRRTTYDHIATAKQYVKKIKNYLNYMMEIKIHNEDLRQNVRWSKEEQRDDYPLSHEEARIILEQARDKKPLYLFLMGTGIAIGEAMRLRKRDFTKSERYKITIPENISESA